MANPSSQTVRIKKYANRRLYNTSTSSYVTLDSLAQMVREGVDFAVEDAKSGEDITRAVLTQIIVEEESKGAEMLPINFLRQLIALYGDNLQSIVPRYLEQSMAMFGSNQERFREYLDGMKDKFGAVFPFEHLNELSKQNIAFMEQAMRMFNPFTPQSSDKPKENEQGDPALDELKNQMQQMQEEIEKLWRGKGEQG
ncbi:MAG TPA: polyhydroxyalkanoate synthesis repressor PhaR [Dongiaceae bacterium]|jgi:polyhydroxyalkanoate synthesis repressor PhaR|nr:polyhydroxyalkanoate synthesis repressor PhaR [Dongiaceae bacterium]